MIPFCLTVTFSPVARQVKNFHSWFAYVRVCVCVCGSGEACIFRGKAQTAHGELHLRGHILPMMCTVNVNVKCKCKVLEAAAYVCANVSSRTNSAKQTTKALFFFFF